MSTGPSCSTTSFTTCPTSLDSVTSSAHTCSPVKPSALRSISATVAPSAVKTSAIARPMPLAAPVTTATLPSTERSGLTRGKLANMSDPFLGYQRPFGLGFWPLAEDDPGTDLDREDVRIVTDDLALVRGILWTPAGRMPETAVILTHPR